MGGTRGGAVGIAGSVAIEIENSRTLATLAGPLDAGTGDVKIEAASNTETATSALPSAATGGVGRAAKVGIGASVAVAIVGVVGFFAHRTTDRRSWRSLAVLFLVSFVGVVLYLNLKAGPSFGAGFLPPTAPHEARERDYFFFFAFVCWGLWAGFGAIRLSRLLPAPFKLVAMVLPFAPALLNWSAVDRRTDIWSFGCVLYEMLTGRPPFTGDFGP